MEISPLSSSTPPLGKLRVIGVSEVVNSIWKYGDASNDFRGHYIHSVYLDKLNKADTYIVIFGPSQALQLETLLKSNKIKVLYQSKKAINKYHGGDIPRNTLVVFEVVDGTE